MTRTRIEWADQVWNVVSGCSPCSPGCDHCYAARFAKRLAGRNGYDQDNPFGVIMHSDTKLYLPARLRKPSRIFVNSMGDLGHPGVASWWLRRMLNVMWLFPVHTYLVLTKRPGTLHRHLQMALDDGILTAIPGPTLPSSLWVGVSVENEDYVWRIDELMEIPTVYHFVSLEPLLGKVFLPPERLKQLDWVIVGEETGPGKRLCSREWVDDLQDQCRAYSIPFFDKQNPLAQEFPR